jgi:saccharopine dehydrogenase-like NADP-dependent oxidoreductase
MRRVLVLGAGKIGGAIVDLLGATGDWEVTVADQQREFLGLIDEEHAARKLVDVSDASVLRELADGHDYLVSALPFFLNRDVAGVARDVAAHYFDLTEDVATTRAVRAVADGADTAFVPQCGLAPGFISVAAFDLASRFDRLREVRMRVGALPQFPVDTLKYNLTWSTDGLINEYCNPCEAILEGRLTEVLPLEGLESFSLDGVDYEAFNTSGGLGTLCETLEGRVDRLDYKTVRYPGHRDVMKMLLEDLRLRDRRELLKDVLERSVPITHQDVVLIFVTVSGWRDARLTQETYARKVYAREVGGRLMSAIQLTTAAGVCAMVDLHAKGQLPQRGFVRQEQAALELFLANRFGRHYNATPNGGVSGTRPATSTP